MISIEAISENERQEDTGIILKRTINNSAFNYYAFCTYSFKNIKLFS